MKIAKNPDIYRVSDKVTGKFEEIPKFIATYDNGEYIRVYKDNLDDTMVGILNVAMILGQAELTALWSISTKQ